MSVIGTRTIRGQTFLMVVSICCFIMIFSNLVWFVFLGFSNISCLFNHLICADFDPVGMFCTMDRGVLNPAQAHAEILLNDENHLLYNSVLNFRSKSQVIILSFGPFKEVLTSFFV